MLNLIRENSSNILMTYICSILLLFNQTRKPVNKKRNMKVYPAEGPVPEGPVPEAPAGPSHHSS
jgi:hypothetical protein